MRYLYVGLFLLTALLAGCASGCIVMRPFMFKEAKLPEGFPQPGAVGEVVVKQYPACRLAHMRGERGVEGGPNVMFQPLFNHIKRNDIPMTAPVEMEYASEPSVGAAGERATSMAFLYRAQSWGTLGPDANDQRVVVEDMPPVTVVSIGVRGSYSDARFEQARDKLHQWLKKHERHFRIVGTPRYLGYNSPFVPGFLRYGEVQIPVAHVEYAGEEQG